MKQPCLNNLANVFLLFIAILISSCGGSGGSGGGAGSPGGGGGGDIGNPPASTPQTILSGTVKAPNGQIAFSSPQNLLEKFLDVIIPTAYAQITGFTPVSDGTTVELDRINDSGVVLITLSITTTSGGSYSFNLTKLGVSFTSRLIVRVTNLNTGVQMRAFAGIGLADINPSSEAAVRIVLEKIAMNSGMSLFNFTPQEQNDIMASIGLLTTVKNLQLGSSIETTVTAIINSVSIDSAIKAFINSASASGPTGDGPGDIGNYFPLRIGNTWNYQRTEVKSNSPPIPPFIMTSTISGSKMVNMTQTFVNTEANYDNTGTSRESYWAKDKISYSEYGDSGTAFTLSPQLGSFINAIFPLQSNVTIGQFNYTGLDLGQDLDLDGVNETADIVYQAKIAAFETVSLQAGTFDNAVRVERVLTITVHYSRTNQNVVSGGPVTEWFAPGIGLIKSIQQINTTGQSQTNQETITDELISYSFLPPALTPGTWTTRTPMPTDRYYIGSGVINGILYVVGGSSTHSSPWEYLPTVEAYDSVTDIWTTKTPMPTARYAHATGVINGILYAAGGLANVSANITHTLGAYDPVTDTWSTKAPMPTARYGATAGVVNGILYVVGGTNFNSGNYGNIVEAYDPVTDTWTTKALFPQAGVY